MSYSTIPRIALLRFTFLHEEKYVNYRTTKSENRKKEGEVSILGHVGVGFVSRQGLAIYLRMVLN